MAKKVRSIAVDTSKVKKFDAKKYAGRKNYPDSGINPKDKGQEYHQRMAEKIYSLILNKGTWMTKSTFDKIDHYRAWSDGNQDVSEMLDWILGRKEVPKEESFDANGYDLRDDETTESKKKAWTNIDTTPVSVFPKIKTKINEHIRSMYYEMSVNAIDSYSVKEEESKKYRLWFYKQNKEWMDSQMAMVGITPEEPEFMPENMEELHLYASTGGFKMPYTIAMEDLVRHTFLISGWDKDVAEKLRDDLMTIGHTIIKEDYDREMKRVVVRACNLKYSGLQYSDTGYKDSEYGYELTLEECSKIRQRLNLTEDQAAMLAYSYSGLYGNPEATKWNEYNGIHADDSGNESLGFDFYKIPVLNFEFLDIDNEKYIETHNSVGQKRTKPYNDKLQENEELKEHQYRYVREGKWIVGTHHLYDWGKKEYIPRDEFGKPRISYRGVKLNTIPLLKQVLPFLKGFQLAWMKAQNAIALAVGNGFAVDIGSIKGIAIGKGQNWDPLEVLAYYRQTGFMLYRQNKSLSGLSRYSSNPVIPIQNATYDNIRIQFEAMNTFVQKVEDTSGISMVSTGKTPDPDVAKFNMQISIQGTNDIINNIVRAQTDVQEDISVNVCYRIRSLCRVNPSVRKSYEDVIGINNMKAVMAAEKNHVSYGIYIQASDITEEKRNIFALIQQAITPTGSGDQAKLDLGEGVLIFDMVHQGQNLRKIGLIVGYWSKRKERKAEKLRKELIAIQADKQNEGKLIEAQKAQQEQVGKQRENYMKFNYDFMLKYGMTPEQYMTNKNQ